MDKDGAASSIPGVPFDKFPLEIQSQIANSFDERSLFNAIIVNKEWCLRLIDLLWHTASINTVFLSPTGTRTKSRRQYYAAKIRMMSIGSTLHPSLHEGLKFHSIQCLNVHGFKTADETWLFPLLRSTLRSLQVRAYCDLNSRVLAALQKCNQLRSLALKGIMRSCNEEKLMAYLREAPSLREVSLHTANPSYGGDRSLIAKMLNAVLRRGNFETLFICSELSEDCFAEHISTLAASFPLNANLLRSNSKHILP